MVAATGTAPRTRRTAPSVDALAVVLVAAAVALLLALLMTDGGAPLALAAVTALASFGTLVGAWRMLRGVSR